MRRQLAGIFGSVTQVTGPHGTTTTTATNFTSLTRNVTVGSEPNKVMVAWVFAENANIGNARPSSVTLTVGGNVQNFVRRKNTEVTNATIWTMLQLWTLDNPNFGSGTVQATGFSGTVAGGGIIVFYVSNAKAGGPDPVRGWAEADPASSVTQTFWDTPPGGFTINAFASPETFNLTTRSSFNIKQVQANAGTLTGAACGYFQPASGRAGRNIGWNAGGTIARWALIGAAFHPVGTSYFPGFASFGSLILHCEDEVVVTDANVDTWVNIGVTQTNNLTASGVNRPQTGRTIFGRRALNFIAGNPTVLTNGLTSGASGTVFAVIRPDLVQNNPWIMNMGGGTVGTSGVSFFITNSGHPRITLYDGSVSVPTPVAGNGIAENEIAIVYGYWTINPPDVAVVGWHLGTESTADVSAITNMANPASTMRVGQSASNAFDGSIALLVYYNARLSNANITRILDELKIRYTPATDGSTATPIPFNTEAPAITVSSLTQGNALTCSTGTWLNSPTSFAYQWLRGTTTILGAIEATYITVSVDVGTYISCRITATNSSGSNSATSENVGPIEDIASGTWLLQSGVWSDIGSWNDASIWID